MLENDAKYFKSKKPPKLAGKLWNFFRLANHIMDPFVCVGPLPTLGYAISSIVNNAES